MTTSNQPNTPQTDSNPEARGMEAAQKAAQKVQREKIKTVLGSLLNDLKETYIAPLGKLIAIIGGGAGDQIGEGNRQKVEGFGPFMASFWNELTMEGMDNPQKSVAMQKALTDFNLALALMSHFRLKSSAHMKQYFQEHGVEDCETLPHYEEMSVINGPLFQAVMQTLKLNGQPYMKKCHQLLDKKKGKEMHFPALAMGMFTWHKGAKNPENRRKIQAIFKAMLETFHQTLEDNPHLKEFLDAAEKPMLESIRVKNTKEKNERKLHEKHTEGVEQLFRLRAPEFKTALEQLYALKSLDGKRLFGWSQTEAGKAFLAPFGIDANGLAKDTADEYLGIRLKDALKQLDDAGKQDAMASEIQEVITGLEKALPKMWEAVKANGNQEDSEAMELLEESLNEIKKAAETGQTLDDVDEAVELILNVLSDMPSKMVDFMLNTSLGRKKARDESVSFSSLKTVMEEKINSILEVLLHEFPKGKEACSLKELVSLMVNDKDVTLAGGYERVIVLGNLVYEQTKASNQAIWSALKKNFSAPKEDVLEIAQGAIDELKDQPEYRETIQWFNFLVAVMQNRLVPPNNRHLTGRFADALAKCQQAFGHNGEGFNRDYSQHIPGVPPKDCDFSKFDTPFDFDTLIGLYAKGVSDSRLIDLKREIETRILQPIMVELGILIDGNQAYDPDRPAIGNYYISQEDYDMAKQMKTSLAELKNTAKEVKKAEMPEEEEKKEKKEYALNTDEKTIIQRIRNQTSAQIVQQEEKARKQAEKEAAREAAKK